MSVDQGKQVFKIAASRWSEEKSCKFITVYEKYECLWNTKSSAYKNKDARGTAVRKLISDIEELGIKITEDESSQLINHAAVEPRSFVMKETDDEIHSPQDLNAAGGDTRIDSPEALISTSKSPVKTTQTPRTYHVRPNLKQLKRSGDDTSSAINKSQKICESATESLKDDEFEIFGRYVANQLRNMNIIRAVENQAEISTLLSKGTLLSKARIQDIEDKQNVNGNQISQFQPFAEEESSDSYWASTPQHSTTSGKNSRYLYVDLLST
ncbi:Alcohol dehydrogenase transcription factor Myb/SANT-like [Popillia japonica]|uniref:Alcohol dehydrogenase transcription factor Myb/SANT-like n=1 Tax=Popillia japonica TaxID=7064 RepID=A0AAW1LUW2_POPJA